MVFLVECNIGIDILDYCLVWIFLVYLWCLLLNVIFNYFLGEDLVFVYIDLIGGEMIKCVWDVINFCRLKLWN